MGTSPAPPPVGNLSMADVVRAAYRTMLGRDAESEAVVAAGAAGCRTVEDVFQRFLASDEFREIHERRELFALVQRGLHASRAAIETDVRPERLAALFERVRAQWQTLGEQEPYWSVLTSDRFKMSSIDKHRDEFEGSGRHAMQILEHAVERAGVPMPENGACLELGCGVGRVTRFLAGRFKTVIGVDVSKGNLEICKRYMNESGLDNVEIRLLASPSDLAAMPAFDFLYSVIVFQHNPPPVMKYMLDTLLAKLRPGGIAYFQVPTHTLGYEFSVDRFLASEPAVLDMHALPMPEVLSSLDRAGLVPREVLMDTWTGLYGSHTFLALKRK